MVLIIAAVSLSLVLGQNGIITKAQESSKKYTEAALNEQIAINEVAKYIEDARESETQDPIIPLPDATDMTKPYLPDNTFTKVDGTDLSNGLVIKDSKGNEYVWVEVPMYKTNIYKTATSKTDYTNIEKDLQTYSLK